MANRLAHVAVYKEQDNMKSGQRDPHFEPPRNTLDVYVVYLTLRLRRGPFPRLHMSTCQCMEGSLGLWRDDFPVENRSPVWSCLGLPISARVHETNVIKTLDMVLINKYSKDSAPNQLHDGLISSYRLICDLRVKMISSEATTYDKTLLHNLMPICLFFLFFLYLFIHPLSLPGTKLLNDLY